MGLTSDFNNRKIPIFLQIFLAVNVIQIFIATLMILEVKKISISKIWDRIIYGNFVVILMSISITMLLDKMLFVENTIILHLIAIFFTFAVSMVIISVYFLIRPLIKGKKLEIFAKKYLLYYFLLGITIFLSLKLVKIINYPNFEKPTILFLVLLLYIPLVLYFAYVSSHISRSYKEIGFVHEAFFTTAVGSVAIIIMALLILYFNFGFLINTYYHLFTIFILSAFAFIYYFIFVVEYPSLLQPKWKAYMPFDPVNGAFTVTLVLLAVSLYFSVQDPEFILSIPPLTFAVLGGIFAPSAFLFLYTNAFAGETTHGYWDYIKTEIAAHLVITLYVLTIGSIIWNSIGRIDKLLFALFFGFSVFFYLTTAYDIKKLIKDLKIKTTVNPITLIRYLLNTLAIFFTIFFIVILTKGELTVFDSAFEKFPYYPLILILVFFIFYLAFLRRTQRGFEELMERGTITAVTYLAAFGVFLTLFILYLRMGPTNMLAQFPLFGAVFFGYFAILVTEVYSTTTLRIKEYREKKDIVDALNHVAGHFFRTDILEEMWEKVIDKYADLDPELEKARFYPPERTFDLDMVNEKAKASAAVAMLHMMDEVRREKNAPVVPFDDDIKKDIETLLNEKILLLSAELSKGFKEEIYYPKLLEKTFNRINKALTPFVSFEDYENILKK
ncbi:MAG: hypothetical protein ACW980_22780, partial [Promethearchaeota archaeon]